MRNDIIFTTLCISDPALDEYRGHFRGENYYLHTATILINSVLKNTNHSIIVVTDIPDKFVSSDRVIIHDIKQLTNEPRLINGYMNFHLKRYAMQMAFESSYKYGVYVDCDIFIENLHEDIFAWMDLCDVDVAGKLGANNIESVMNTRVYKEKVQQFGPYWQDSFLHATLPFEMFLIFKKNDIKQRLFMDMWNKVAMESVKYDITTLYDSYYIGIAICYSNMNELNFQQSDNSELVNIIDNLWKGIRIIHKENICYIDMTELEPFDYQKTLDKILYAI